jgi:hypothetical protein
MPRNRIIYNVLGLYAGPAPSSGDHFIDIHGNLNNNYFSGDNINLVKNINRVQSANYSIDIPKTNIIALGKRGIIKRANIENPTISLNFNYLQMGLINDARLGFYVNYERFDHPHSGETYYSNNFNVLSIGGFINRSTTREQNDLRWPYLYRDKRNIFIAINNSINDIKINKDIYDEIDVNSTEFGVYAFGNCYLNSYNASAAINSFPVVSVNYVAENLVFYLSGSGINIPAVNPQTRQQYSNIKCAIPSIVNDGISPSALLPGDITVDISGYSPVTGITAIHGTGFAGSVLGSNINDVGIDFRDIKIQSYNIGLEFSREPLNNFGYKLPVDREINFPLFVSLEINALLGDLQSGSILKLLDNDNDYNLTIKLKNPRNQGEKPGSGVAIRYDFLRSKLDNISFDSNIGDNKTVNLNFITEIDPEDFTKGWFISGLLNVDTSSVINNFALYEHPSGVISGDGDFWVQEDGSRIITDSISLFY